MKTALLLFTLLFSLSSHAGEIADPGEVYGRYGFDWWELGRTCRRISSKDVEKFSSRGICTRLDAKDAAVPHEGVYHFCEIPSSRSVWVIFKTKEHCEEERKIYLEEAP